MALKLRATRPPAQGCGTKSVPRQGHNTPFPLERSSPVSFKRLLGAGLRPPTERHERLLLETALTGADPHRRGIRGNTRSPLAPDVLGGIRENTRSPLAQDALGGQNSRLTAPAVYLTPLKLNVCEVRRGCGKRPPKADAALVVRSSRARS